MADQSHRVEIIKPDNLTGEIRHCDIAVILLRGRAGQPVAGQVEANQPIVVFQLTDQLFPIMQRAIGPMQQNERRLVFIAFVANMHLRARGQEVEE